MGLRCGKGTDGVVSTNEPLKGRQGGCVGILLWQIHIDSENERLKVEEAVYQGTCGGIVPGFLLNVLPEM